MSGNDENVSPYATATFVGHISQKADVSDRIFKRKLNTVIDGIDQLSAELKHTRETLLSGGKIRFNTAGTVAELEDLIAELKSARLEEFEESYPPNTGVLGQ